MAKKQNTSCSFFTTVPTYVKLNGFSFCVGLCQFSSAAFSGTSVGMSTLSNPVLHKGGHCDTWTQPECCFALFCKEEKDEKGKGFLKRNAAIFTKQCRVTNYHCTCYGNCWWSLNLSLHLTQEQFEPFFSFLETSRARYLLSLSFAQCRTQGKLPFLSCLQ